MHSSSVGMTQKTTMKLKLATYNILHGFHSELVTNNIKFLIEQGANIICLQEADPPIEGQLVKLFGVREFKAWKVKYLRLPVGGDLAILWDSARLNLQNTENLFLARLPKPALNQRVTFKKDGYQRAALLANFLFNGKTLRVTNTHLAWEGGIKHRFFQLKQIKETLQKQPVDCEILAGDFNTLANNILLRRHEKKAENILGKEWINAFPKLRYSYDLVCQGPKGRWNSLVKLCLMLGIKMRLRLDYVFARNLKATSRQMFDLPGSDHKPLLAEFEI
jgi:endonuclease/exonuclease/phosphatase family metal-dependent hydrolase